MALLINNAAPAGGDSPTAGDDQIRAFKLAVQDIFGIPNNTTISQAVMDVDAGGLAQVIFYDAAVLPASGELGRNGSPLYYRITDARTATTTRALGIVADTSGTPAASIGVGVLFQAESADEAPADFGALDFVASDIGAGTEDTYLSIPLRVAGRALDEKYRFGSTAGDGFTAIFAHAVTADRTYTLPDSSGTLLVSAAAAHGRVTVAAGTTGTTNIAHGLGVAPRLVIIFAGRDAVSNGQSWGTATGVAAGDQSCQTLAADGTYYHDARGTGYIFVIATADNATTAQRGQVTTLDATNITLTHTISGAGYETFLHWTAMA